MIDFPNAKINIGLNIIHKRSDGYHDIESLFYPIGLCDILEFIPQSSFVENSALMLSNTGVILPDSVENNLCAKAWKLVKADFSIPPIRMHLHKVIPPGSGLGGGSSNGSFTIKMLSRAFSLGMSQQDMEIMAGKLGSDCPFFIKNQPALATSRGEVLLSVSPILSGYHIIIIHPGIHINTGEAYARSNPSKPQKPLSELIRLPVEEWKNTIENDFEEIVFSDYPEIGQLKDTLYSKGAIYSSLSGSGSAVYGIFHEQITLENIPEEYFTWQGKLS